MCNKSNLPTVIQATDRQTKKYWCEADINRKATELQQNGNIKRNYYQFQQLKYKLSYK